MLHSRTSDTTRAGLLRGSASSRWAPPAPAEARLFLCSSSSLLRAEGACCRREEGMRPPTGTPAGHSCGLLFTKTGGGDAAAGPANATPSPSHQHLWYLSLSSVDCMKCKNKKGGGKKRVMRVCEIGGEGAHTRAML